MPQTALDPSMKPVSARDQKRSIQILARSLYKQLRSEGYDTTQIVGFASELIGHVTSDVGQGSTAG